MSYRHVDVKIVIGLQVYLDLKRCTNELIFNKSMHLKYVMRIYL